jgi:hypothetical protein
MGQREIKAQSAHLRLWPALVVPFVVETAYLSFSRWPSSRFTSASDFGCFALSMLVGAAFILRLPLRPSRRALALLAYVPLVGAALLLYGLMFLAAAFGDGL